MWTADLAREMDWRASKGTGKEDRARRTDTRRDTRDRAEKPRKGDSKGGGKREAKGAGRAGKGESAVKMGQVVKIKGKSAKTAKSRGSKIFCAFFARGACRNGSSCRDYHTCPVICKSGRGCEKNHTPSQHPVNDITAA